MGPGDRAVRRAPRVNQQRGREPRRCDESRVLFAVIGGAEPVGGDQRDPVPPSLDHGGLVPVLGHVGVLGDDHLQARAQLGDDVADELEDPAAPTSLVVMRNRRASGGIVPWARPSIHTRSDFQRSGSRPSGWQRGRSGASAATGRAPSPWSRRRRHRASRGTARRSRRSPVAGAPKASRGAPGRGSRQSAAEKSVGRSEVGISAPPDRRRGPREPRQGAPGGRSQPHPVARRWTPRGGTRRATWPP